MAGTKGKQILSVKTSMLRKYISRHHIEIQWSLSHHTNKCLSSLWTSVHAMQDLEYYREDYCNLLLQQLHTARLSQRTEQLTPASFIDRGGHSQFNRALGCWSSSWYSLQSWANGGSLFLNGAERDERKKTCQIYFRRLISKCTPNCGGTTTLVGMRFIRRVDHTLSTVLLWSLVGRDRQMVILYQLPIRTFKTEVV